MNNLDVQWSLQRVSVVAGLAVCLLSTLFARPAVAAEAVCARVKIEIQQEVALERQAFDAAMRINNGLDTLAIEDVNVTVGFTDEAGNAVLASSDPNSTDPNVRFFIRVDRMEGISDVSGTGRVEPGTTGEIHWLIIPVPGAADGVPTGKLYFVGAKLSYTLGGEPETVEVTPDFITVKPMPKLALDYFLTREVIADDAFTPEVEAPEPYTLGVRVRNKGTGPAQAVQIDSAQPKIVENEQGLLVDFQIAGSSIDDQPAAPTLLLDFGEIAPADARVGRWIMQSSLSGQFVEFSANVSHADELGGQLTSLIDANDLNTHFLIRDVRVDLPGRDGVRDFLAYPAGGDGSVLRVYESNTNDSEVADLSGSAEFALQSESGGELFHSLAVPVTAGFMYVKLPDPYAGTKTIKSVVRTDGKWVPQDNAWTSKTRNRDTSPPSWEYWVNFFDVNTTGNYVVQMGEPELGSAPPVLQTIADRTTYEGGQVGFQVGASDPNGDPLTLSAEPLPSGATFVDNGDGTGLFNWTPAVGQSGLYAITYKASDGGLTVSRTAAIRVHPEWDTDGDGLDNAWEMEHFGNLDRDGSGDADGDGVSDYDEFLNGTDPNLPPPPAPDHVLGFSGNGQSTLMWSTVDDATGYRAYWSNEPGVDRISGLPLDGVMSPFVHDSLSNGTTYYYIVTSVGPGGESAGSPVVSVTPGQRDWGIPDDVSATSFTTGEVETVFGDTGDALTVWTQANGEQADVWASRFVAGTGWESPVRVDTGDVGDASGLDLAINPAGEAIAIWRETAAATESTVWAATFTPATGWAVPQQVAAAAAIGEPDVERFADGAALAAWTQGSSESDAAPAVWAARLDGGLWQPPVQLDAGTASDTAGLQLAVDAAGAGLAIWSETTDGVSYDLVYARLDGTGGWGTAQTLRSNLQSDGSQPAVTGRLAMNAAGDAFLIWGEAASPDSVWASRFSPTGGWETAARVEGGAAGAYHPDVAVDGEGNAVAVWVQSDGTSQVLYTNRYSAGAWSSEPTRLSGASQPAVVGDAAAPAVLVDGQGDALVAWQQGDGVQSNIWSRRFEAASGTWKDALIIELDNTGDAGAPVLAANTHGDGIVVWPRQDGDRLRIAANTYLSGNAGMPNVPPVAITPTAMEVDEQTSVLLDASGSFDQDGSVVGYAWIQESGDPVTLTGQDMAQASFLAPTLTMAETLGFSLLVTDDEGMTTEARVSVVVNPVNALPSAAAGPDQSVDEQTPVTLSGGGSDSDGTIVQYVWTQIEGTPVVLNGADAATAGFVAPALKSAETLRFELTVTDNEHATATDEVAVVVNPVNHPPVVEAGAEQSVDEQTEVILSGAASDPDADGQLIAFAWSQESGPAVSLNGADALVAGFTAPTLKAPANLVFRLVVTDDEGGQGDDTVQVIIHPVNHPPVVDAGPDQAVDEQTAVSLSGTASDPDADGVLVSYRWSQASGPAVTLAGGDQPQAGFTAPTLKEPALLAFDLIVTDDEGGVTSDRVQITVNPVNHPPVVDTGADQIVDEQTAVALAGSASDPDADGVLVSHVWTQLSGPAVVITPGDGPDASFTAPTLKKAQTLAFALTVTDDEGGVSADSVQVTVNPVNHPPVVDAGADFLAEEKLTTALSGQAEDPDADGILVAYEWVQTAGPAVLLNGADSASAGFMTPAVYQDTVLGFRLTVSDDEGGVTADSVQVTVYSTDPDDDKDGMHDLWEIQYFGTLDRDGTDDFDGDGATDQMEFGFKTDPTVPQGPGEPMVQSPDGTEVTTLQPTLMLQNAEHHPSFPVTYEFEVYRDPAMTQLVAKASGQPESSAGTSGWTVDVALDDNTWFYWRARAVGWTLVSPWVDSRFFVNRFNDAPGAIQISSPADGAWVDTFTPALSVTNSVDVDEDALTYGFDVSEAGGVSVTAISGLVPGADGTTGWTVDLPLVENGWYTWQGVVTDEHGAATPSPTGRFFVNTVNDAPGEPAVFSPGWDEEIASQLVTMSAGGSVDPEAEPISYHFELDTANTFDTSALRESGPIPDNLGEGYWTVTGLADNTLFYWRVKASDGRAESAWEIGSFFVNTVNDPPSVPSPKNPGEGGWVGTMTPTVEVYPATDVDRDRLSYEFEIYAANKHGKMLRLVAAGASDTSSWQITPALEKAGWYYWQVRAVDEHGLAGSWGEPVFFYADDDGVNDPPSIRFKGIKEKQNDPKLTIRWNDKDVDSNATVSLYYDTDGYGEDGVLIVSGLPEDPGGKSDWHVWDTAGVPAGVYYVYAVIDDGNSSAVDYSPNAVVVKDGGGHPIVGITDVTIDGSGRRSWVDIDWESRSAERAAVSLYYDHDSSGQDGTLIAYGLQPSTGASGSGHYRWDVSGVPEGEYFVYAVIENGHGAMADYADTPLRIERRRWHKALGAQKPEKPTHRGN